tara:strand:- start:78 stop:722 length:645 start_codon:yes stop_codon:yes gene_type:complete
MTQKKTKQTVFEDLFNYNANEFKEQKGKYDYISWSDALAIVLQKYPDTTWEVHEFDFPVGNQRQDELGAYNGWIKQPYMKTDTGYFVKVSVCIQGVTRTQIHPVIDNVNKTILKPNAYQINTSIARCLVKCFALHGLGLYIYQGEDLPQEEAVKVEENKPKDITEEQKKYLLSLVANKDEGFKNMIQVALDNKKINSSNINSYIDQFKEKKEQK